MRKTREMEGVGGQRWKGGVELRIGKVKSREEVAMNDSGWKVESKGRLFFEQRH